jgi:hypothetical protein
VPVPSNDGVYTLLANIRGEREITHIIPSTLRITYQQASAVRRCRGDDCACYRFDHGAKPLEDLESAGEIVTRLNQPALLVEKTVSGERERQLVLGLDTCGCSKIHLVVSKDRDRGIYQPNGTLVAAVLCYPYMDAGALWHSSKRNCCNAELSSMPKRACLSGRQRVHAARRS